ncbi:Hypothetical_protein [Hexamita inflata]|uniref:Hypothetical_protein n=1 Tax=Hexamita inflata TaxID=28002 RepID=A0AA86UQX0_9EUKA|nr:Hypothetical protein HINF_LOCUS48721 [Hexamita inflata]
MLNIWGVERLVNYSLEFGCQNEFLLVLDKRQGYELVKGLIRTRHARFNQRQTVVQEWGGGNLSGIQDLKDHAHVSQAQLEQRERNRLDKEVVAHYLDHIWRDFAAAHEQGQLKVENSHVAIGSDWTK